MVNHLDNGSIFFLREWVRGILNNNSILMKKWINKETLNNLVTCLRIYPTLSSFFLVIQSQRIFSRLRLYLYQEFIFYYIKSWFNCNIVAIQREWTHFQAHLSRLTFFIFCKELNLITIVRPSNSMPFQNDS